MNEVVIAEGRHDITPAGTRAGRDMMVMRDDDVRSSPAVQPNN